MNKKTYENLPVEIKEDIKNTLKAYDKVSVIFENGKYIVSTGTCLKAIYADDFKVIGDFTKEEIFTENERIENYINSFMSYPSEYNGKKDWDLISKMNDDRTFDEKNDKMYIWQGKLNNEGNFILLTKKTEFEY